MRSLLALHVLFFRSSYFQGIKHQFHSHILFHTFDFNCHIPTSRYHLLINSYSRKVSKKSNIFVFKITISSACYFLYLGQSISDGCSRVIGVCFIHTLTPPPFIAIRIITRIHVLFIEFRKAVIIVNNIFWRL